MTSRAISARPWLEVYIDPFTLSLGGVDILEVRGVTSEDKTSARVLLAQKDAEKARREAASKVAMEVGPDRYCSPCHTAQLWWGGQMGMARGAVWSRSLR